MQTELTRPLLLGTAEVAALLGVSTRTVLERRRSGQVPAPVWDYRPFRWRASEIGDWIDAGCPDRETWDKRKKG